MSTTARRTKRYIRGTFEVKEKDEAKRTFRGVLSTSHIDSGDWTGVRDIVWPGAFKRTLKSFKSAADPYMPLINSHQYHDIFHVLGDMLDGEEVLTGKTVAYELESGGTIEVPEMMLETEWQIIDGIDGDRVLDRIRPGAVRKMSMGYERRREDYVVLKGYGRTRNLREVALKEGSLVVFAMNDRAETDPGSVKALLAALRDGAVTDQQKQELRALLTEAPPAPAPPPPADPPTDGPAQTGEKMDAQEADRLRLRLRMVTLKGRAAVSGTPSGR